MGKCNRWDDTLSSCGFRMTRAREVIMAVLQNTTEHLSADDIYIQIHIDQPEIGLTTVYRTLEILKNTNIVVKFDYGEGRSRYELSEEYGNKKHHHHLICTGCQKIIDYFDFQDKELEYVEHTEKGLAKKYNFEITKHMIRFYGVCEKCRKMKTRS